MRFVAALALLAFGTYGCVGFSNYFDPKRSITIVNKTKRPLLHLGVYYDYSKIGWTDFDDIEPGATRTIDVVIERLKNVQDPRYFVTVTDEQGKGQRFTNIDLTKKPKLVVTEKTPRGWVKEPQWSTTGEKCTKQIRCGVGRSCRGVDGMYEYEKEGVCE